MPPSSEQLHEHNVLTSRRRAVEVAIALLAGATIGTLCGWLFFMTRGGPAAGLIFFPSLVVPVLLFATLGVWLRSALAPIAFAAVYALGTILFFVIDEIMFPPPPNWILNFQFTLLDGLYFWGFLFVPEAGSSLLAWWIRFESPRRIGLRPRYRKCRACKYNLTGNVTGVCPECGTLVCPQCVEQFTKVQMLEAAQPAAVPRANPIS